MTGKYCDCGTSLGSRKAVTGRMNLDKSKEIKKLEKKGWSQKKIERSIEQKEILIEKRKSNQKNTGESCQEWVDIINELLHNKATRRFSLLLHWYSKSLESEKINIVGKFQISLNELDSEYLESMDEDSLYSFIF